MQHRGPTRRRVAAALGALAPFSIIGCAAARPDADAIVIGAGLAGLAAARVMEAEGLSVTVLEASPRIGGRLMTLTDLPGKPEAGGAQVGGGYARIRATAKALGLALAPSREGDGRGPALALGARVIPAEAWATDTANPFPDPLKVASPASVLLRLAGAENPLPDPLAWKDPSAAAHDVSADAFLAARGFSEAARKLVDLGLNANTLASYSMLNVYRTLRLYEQDRALGPVGRIEAGAQALPEAMAASLKTGVRTGAPVTAIVASADGVTVRLASGETLRAPFAIMALPFPALRGVALEAPLAAMQREAIAKLPYTQIIQVHLEAEKRFWETDGLSPDMWTDGPLERIFAGRDESGGATGMFNAWINGAGASALAQAPDADLARLAQAEFQRLRPESGGAVKLARVVRWTAEASGGPGGAYMHFAPGQVARWAAVMGAPAGRLHFAGEHLGVAHTGMEAAMESGEAAGRAVLQATGAFA